MPGAEIEAASGDEEARRSDVQNPDIWFPRQAARDVIRTLAATALFRRIEYIRSTSVDRHRGVVAADAIDPGLDRPYAARHARLRARLHALLPARQSREDRRASAEPGADFG